MTTIKSDSLSEKDAKASELTQDFTEHDHVGEDKSADTTDDVSAGMPEENQDKLEKVTDA